MGPVDEMIKPKDNVINDFASRKVAAKVGTDGHEARAEEGGEHEQEDHLVGGVQHGQDVGQAVGPPELQGGPQGAVEQPAKGMSQKIETKELGLGQSMKGRVDRLKKELEKQMVMEPGSPRRTIKGARRLEMPGKVKASRKGSVGKEFGKGKGLGDSLVQKQISYYMSLVGNKNIEKRELKRKLEDQGEIHWGSPSQRKRKF